MHTFSALTPDRYLHSAKKYSSIAKIIFSFFGQTFSMYESSVFQSVTFKFKRTSSFRKFAMLSLNSLIWRCSFSSAAPYLNLTLPNFSIPSGRNGKPGCLRILRSSAYSRNPSRGAATPLLFRVPDFSRAPGTPDLPSTRLRPGRRLSPRSS